MPRRVAIISPEIGVWAQFRVRFTDNSRLIVLRTATGYVVKGGKPKFTCNTKTELDLNLSIIAEDRGGDADFNV